MIHAVTGKTRIDKLSLREQVGEVLEGGAIMVQPKEGELDRGNFEEALGAAWGIRRIIKDYNVSLMVDDGLELVLTCRVDGLHVGQNNMEAFEARRFLGSDHILGVMVKTVDQARKAQAAGADYLGNRTMFGTNTKAGARPMTTEILSTIYDCVDTPMVAIREICLDNIGHLTGNHAAGAAIVSGIFRTPNIRETTEKLIGAMEEITRLSGQDLRAGSA